MPSILNDYTIYLANLIGVNYEKYRKLMDLLMDTEFIYSIRGDRNRLEDGRYQRFDYIRETGAFNMELETRFVSVLEVLTAFAIRLDHDWIGDPDDPRPDIIFTEMLENLGIFYKDEEFDPRAASISLKKWLNRKFTSNGVGSIFPLNYNRSGIDQRKVEIWMQMTAYLHENY